MFPLSSHIRISEEGRPDIDLEFSTALRKRSPKVSTLPADCVVGVPGY
jgi:hypothetical protein